MAKKLNSMPDYVARLPRESHDLSQSFAYTSCPSMILPLYQDMLHFGDEIFFNASQFIRLQPLHAAALGKIDVHLDYFFVPLTYMYTPSSSMFYQTDDLLSSNFESMRGNEQSSHFPVVKMEEFFQSVYQTAAQSTPFSVGDFAMQLPFSIFDCYGKQMYRLFDHLQMAPNRLLTRLKYNDSRITLPNFTPWFALAYQAIYQDYFRNDDREPRNYHYNIDKFYQTGEIYPQYYSDGQKSIFTLNYASRPKDYFNSVKVSPMGSAVSMLQDPTAVFYSVNNWININSSTLVNANSVGEQSFGGDSVSSGVYDNGTYMTGILNSSSIRQLFMIDKLYRVIGRAEKNYESQFLAHYGIKIPHDVMHSITHIGHDMATFGAEPVISQANTYDETSDTGSALGEVGGQGSVMLTGKKHRFKAPFHGVFMCVCHVMPRRRYLPGFDKLHNMTGVTDFYQPEFDKKGMQPLFRYEANELAPVGDRLGWQFAYEQFKRKYDKISNAFRVASSAATKNHANMYSSWVLSAVPYGTYDNNGLVYSQRSDVDWMMLLGSPNDLNSIFQIPHETRWDDNAIVENPQSPGDYVIKPWLLYSTDPFICDFHMNMKKVNSMSEYGEPEL